MGRDVLKITLVRIVGAGLLFLYSVFLARTTSQSDFGNVQYFINFCQLFALIVSGGFETTIVRYAPTYWHERKFAVISALRRLAYSTALRNIVILGFAIYTLKLVGVDLPVNDSPVMILLVTLGCFVVSISSLHRDLMRSFGWIYRCIWPQSFWRTSVAIIFSLILLWTAQLRGPAAILAFCGGLIVALAVELLYLRSAKLPQATNNAELSKSWKASSRTIFAADIAHNCLYKGAGLFVGALFGLEIAALFYAADRIATLTQFIGEGVQLAAGPKISLAAQSSSLDLQKAARQASLLCFFSGIPMVFGVAIFTPLVLELFGRDFRDATSMAVILVIGSAGYATFGPTPMVANMMGLVRERLIVTIGGVLLQISFVILAYSIDGFLFAAIGVAASIWFVHGVLALVIWRKTSIKTGVFSFSAKDISSFAVNGKRFVLSFKVFNK